MNQNKEILNEKSYRKMKKGFIIVGVISLIIAVILLVIAITMQVPQMGDEAWFNLSSKRMLLFAGAFIFGIMIPLVTFSRAFAREMMAYSAQQVMPVAQEGIEKMAPSIGKATKEITKGVKEGLKDKEE